MVWRLAASKQHEQTFTQRQSAVMLRQIDVWDVFNSIHYRLECRKVVGADVNSARHYLISLTPVYSQSSSAKSLKFSSIKSVFVMPEHWKGLMIWQHLNEKLNDCNQERLWTFFMGCENLQTPKITVWAITLHESSKSSRGFHGRTTPSQHQGNKGCLMQQLMLLVWVRKWHLNKPQRLQPMSSCVFGACMSKKQPPVWEDGKSLYSSPNAASLPKKMHN